MVPSVSSRTELRLERCGVPEGAWATRNGVAGRRARSGGTRRREEEPLVHPTVFRPLFMHVSSGPSMIMLVVSNQAFLVREPLCRKNSPAEQAKISELLDSFAVFIRSPCACDEFLCPPGITYVKIGLAVAVIQSTETCLWNGETAVALVLTFELPWKTRQRSQ